LAKEVTDLTESRFNEAAAAMVAIFADYADRER
jgi:hypothetical protein